jgi:hypothetical protein
MYTVETTMIYFLKEEYVQVHKICTVRQNMYSYICVDLIQLVYVDHIQGQWKGKRKA